MHGRRRKHCKAKQTWYLFRSNRQKKNPSSSRRGLSKANFAQNEMEMTGRPTQGSRGDQRENVVFGAFTCRSSRSLDEREQLSVFGAVGTERGGDSQLEPQLHEEAPPEQPQSPFILMVGLVGGCGVVVVMLELEVGSCFVGLLVMMMTVKGWGGGNGEGMGDTYTHRGGQLRTADGYVVPCLLHGEEDRKADSWAARFVLGFHCVLFCVLCAGGDQAEPSPVRPDAEQRPGLEGALTNGISSEAHDHPPGSVPSGWRCWTLNDSDGFRGHWRSDPAAGLAGQGGAMRHASPPTRAVCEICA